MADFTFAYEECEAIKEYPVLVSEFEEQSEQRRLVTSKKLVGFQVKMPNMTVAQFQALEAFYDSKKGSLTAFTFERYGVVYTVRFDGPIRDRHAGGIVQSSFNLKLIHQVED